MAAALLAPAGAAPGALPDYQLAGSFQLPSGASSFDVLPDGRLIAISGTSILTQNLVASSAFEVAGSVPAGVVSPFGASFLRVSPSGTRLAIGDNDFGPDAQVHLLDVSSLSPQAPAAIASYPIDNYDAHWSDDHTLWISGGSPIDTLVTRLDAQAQSFGPVVRGIGGASGGIATSATHLFTANGFSFTGPSATGDIKAFALSALIAGAPVDFESSGTLVATVLSGNTLGFDAGGHLLVGGGPGGYAAVVEQAEIAAALAGAPPATTLLQLSPTSSGTHFVRHNPATGELLITTFGDPTVYRYAIVPAPASALLLLAATWRRRRD